MYTKVTLKSNRFNLRSLIGVIVKTTFINYLLKQCYNQHFCEMLFILSVMIYI